ncbi:MAG: pyrroline-5-carboxylate reductase [Pseudomonadota bacterium]
MSRIAFIGAGNMARSLILGLLDRGHDPARITAADPSDEARGLLATRGVLVTGDNAKAVNTADAIVLATKPQVLAAVLRNLPRLDPHQLLLSIAAGAPMQALEAIVGPTQPIVRCMPNTPALVGEGAAALYANAAVTPLQRQLAESLLKPTSRVTWVDDEALIDSVIAVSGSGPAYFFAMIEAMTDTGEALGLDRAQAQTLAAQTALGAAKMALADGADPAALRRAVTSEGGTTQAALNVLTEAGFAATVEAAMRAAAERARTMAEEFQSK